MTLEEVEELIKNYHEDSREHRTYIKADEVKPMTDEDYIRKVEKLNEYKYIKSDIKYYTTELERVQEYKTAISHVLDGLPSGNVRKRPEDKWIELMDYTDEIIEYLGKQIQQMLIELQEIEDKISRLPARERCILTAHYIADKPFKELEKDLPLSDRTIYHAHKNGVAELDI